MGPIGGGRVVVWAGGAYGTGGTGLTGRRGSYVSRVECGKFSPGVGIRRAGLVRKGLVGTEDGGARLHLVA